MNILGVALGVAVFLAIQLVNRSASESFASSVDLVAGKATLEVRGRIDETLLPALASAPGVRAATPLVQGLVTLAEQPGEYLQIHGIDPFTSAPFQTYRFDLDFEKWLGTPGGVVVSKVFASRNALEVGSRLPVVVNGATSELVVLATLDFENAATAGNSRFALMDIGWAQELFAEPGRLDAIQLQGTMERDVIAALLPPGLSAEAPRSRSRQVNEMLSSFRLNLTALSMVSLLVGMFVIYNTISASVVRRRVETGILRSVGADRWLIRALFMGEALLYGVPGVVLGLLGGWVLAGALLGAVGQTISALYTLTTLEEVSAAPGPFLLATALGVGSVALSSWLPAREAALSTPLDNLLPAAAPDAAHAMPSIHLALAGLVALPCALLTAWLGLRPGLAVLSFASAFLTLITFVLCSGATIQFTSRVIAWIGKSHVLVRIAADNLRRARRRNATTLAAMLSAVAMMIAISVMIFSFRKSVDAWITQSITADIFVGPAANAVTGPEHFIPQSVREFFEHHPDVDLVDSYRQLQLQLSVDGKDAAVPITLATVDGGHRGVMRFTGNEGKFSDIQQADTVLLTESLAHRLGLVAGDFIRMPTPLGEHRFRVAGIYRDYTSDQGLVMMARSNFDRFWNEPGVHSLAIYLGSDADPESILREFEASANRESHMMAYSNRALRGRIFEIFDQTFSVTYLLRTIAVIVSIIGVFITITILVEERRREVALLRCIGLSRGQTQRIFLMEAGLLGLGASVAGLGAGLALAFVLTRVINKAFFGWTIDPAIPWLWLGLVPCWIVPAAVAAAALPAWRAAHTGLASSLRGE